jgi:hypothetical protein
MNFILCSIYDAVTIDQKSICQKTTDQQAMANNVGPCLIKFNSLNNFWQYDKWPNINMPNDNQTKNLICITLGLVL